MHGITIFRVDLESLCGTLTISFFLSFFQKLLQGGMTSSTLQLRKRQCTTLTILQTRRPIWTARATLGIAPGREDSPWKTSPEEVTKIYDVSAPSLLNETLRLQLFPASDFLAEGFVIQRVSGNSTWLEEVRHLHCFYSGYVQGQEVSAVSVALCKRHGEWTWVRSL